ncbi:uncharacterized protein LOC124461396 [Drosophila willistoni]|uniref:uncharacterized protein LOC124461396 n=1 Tax=Drosophila willistoni TaxID=7260 RepID=UPI001F07B3DA|nr:uncharacterized protein LOC124461396 [Drosophila willistoni]
MYRCINIPPDDAQYQRILWNPDTSDYVAEYACTTVMFGTSSAPYLAMRVMKQLAMDECAKYPLAVDVINHHVIMYVDDILSDGDSIAETEDVKNQVIGMLCSGTFELRKWASNCPKLLENIPVEHRESSGLLHMEDLVISYSHICTLHGGTSLTLNFIRKKFWIVNGRNAVRSENGNVTSSTGTPF